MLKGSLIASVITTVMIAVIIVIHTVTNPSTTN